MTQTEVNPQALLELAHAAERFLPENIRPLLGAFGWRERIPSVEGNESGYRLRFFSDGLDLKTKTTIEHILRDAVGAKLSNPSSFVVYFERKEKSQNGENAKSAAAREQAKAQTQQPNKVTPPGRKAIPNVKHIIAVASGKGGVGKSTVSVNFAVALHNQGYKVGILDADIYGPSLPIMLGIQNDPGVNEKNKIIPPERYGLKVMSFGFFAPPESAVIWRGPMIMKALQQFFYDVDWGELDFLVIDLPPGTGDAQLTLVQSLPLAGSVIVTTPQNVALADAVKGIVMFEKTDIPILGVVENMSTFHCPACGVESHIFGEGGADQVSHRFQIPVLGHVPLLSEIREAGDSGKPLASIAGHPMRIRFAEIAERAIRRMFEVRN